MSDSSKDRFGMPESAFRAAIESHGSTSPVIRTGMYVPTREEVATLSVDELQRCLIDWMWESPTELIPSFAQIAEVQAVLEARLDVEKFEGLIAACRDYTQLGSKNKSDSEVLSEKSITDQINEFVSWIEKEKKK